MFVMFKYLPVESAETYPSSRSENQGNDLSPNDAGKQDSYGNQACKSQKMRTECEWHSEEEEKNDGEEEEEEEEEICLCGESICICKSNDLREKLQDSVSSKNSTKIINAGEVATPILEKGYYDKSRGFDDSDLIMTSKGNRNKGKSDGNQNPLEDFRNTFVHPSLTTSVRSDIRIPCDSTGSTTGYFNSLNKVSEGYYIIRSDGVTLDAKNKIVIDFNTFSED